MSEAKIPAVSAILLAAGKSERMGENKLLLPFGGRTVIQRTLDSLWPRARERSSSFWATRPRR